MKFSLLLAAALAVSAFALAPAHAQSTAAGKGKFCHVTTQDAKACTFASMMECEKIAKSQGGRCMENPGNVGTTTTGASPRANAPASSTPAPRGATHEKGGMGSGTK